jgi:hypothetical protein
MISLGLPMLVVMTGILQAIASISDRLNVSIAPL